MTELVAESVRDLAAANPDPKPKGYIPILDGLRAVSIGFVLAGHALMNGSTSFFYNNLGVHLGSYGVSVFFVISGYLITMLLLREERRWGKISLKSFYIRRTLRIFPAFYTYLLCIGILAMLGLIRDVPWHDMVASALYIRNMFGRVLETGHLWSLSLEEQFYLIWPSAVVLLAARRRLGMLTLAVAAFTAWRAYLISIGKANIRSLYMNPDQRMDTILVGCALALLEGGERFERLSHAFLERWWSGAVIFAALAACLIYGPTMMAMTPYFGAVQFTTTGILTIFLVHWLMRREGSWGLRWLEIPPMLFVGRLSYSLYLWQQLFLIGPTPELNLIRQFPLNMTLTFACALGSYYLIERPFLALKDRFVK
jgi:peptidoglycan/LPS O-acetylase OafA/YrhL